MSLKFDAIIKELATAAPEAFVEIIAHVRGEPIQALNVDLSTISTSADLAFGVGEPLRQVIHIDAQTGPDADLPRSVLVYNALLHKRTEVPVRSIVMLLQPKAQLSNLTGVYSYRAERTKVEFEYEIFRLWEQPVAELLNGPVTLLPLAVLSELPGQQTQEVELAQVVQQLASRLEKETTPGHLRQYLLAAYILAGMRFPKTTARTIFEGVILMHESSTYQLIVEEGELRHGRKAVLRVGEKRLGPPNDSTRAAIMASEDLGRLDAMLEVAVTAANWEEILAVPPSPPAEEEPPGLLW